MRLLHTETVSILTILLAFTLVTSVGAKDTNALPLIPEPQAVEIHKGAFSLTPQTRIYTDGASRATGTVLARQLRESTGYPLKTHRKFFTKSAVKGAILLTTRDADPKLGAEGYDLTVAPGSVVIRAPEQAGLFYGVQTLLQLLPPAVFSSNLVDGVNWQLPCARIQDKPRFKWRGFMLDVSRHFYNKRQVERVLDSMASLKLNTFHWHLVDVDGWRIEIKKYPKLTQVGAWRNSIGFDLDPKSSTAYGPDGKYGGYYTQDDIREVIAYARARHITIVPEIEMPGHATAAMACYPELSCSGGPYTIDRGPNYHAGVFCAGNDESFTFLENVLTEVFQLFPSKYIHIGGDEVDKGDWKRCPKCQARMKREGLKNEEELQSYFVKRIEKFVNAHGHTLIGWSEILQGGLAPNAVVMDWKGGGKEAANEGHDVVMTPTAHSYFDHYQSLDHSLEPRAIGGYLPLRAVYSFEPIPAGLAPDKVHHILGAQANLWTEFIASMSYLEYMMFPRLCAMAEVAWSSKASRSWPDFEKRLKGEEQRLAERGVGYRKDKSIPIGKWSPADVSTNGSTLKWDVTGKFSQAGEYHLICDYARGGQGLDISSVSVLEDGKEIVHDAHTGFAGSKPRDPVYHLALPAPKAGAHYTVQAEVKGHGGTDSSGFVTWNLAPTK